MQLASSLLPGGGPKSLMSPRLAIRSGILLALQCVGVFFLCAVVEPGNTCDVAGPGSGQSVTVGARGMVAGRATFGAAQLAKPASTALACPPHPRETTEPLGRPAGLAP